jgi:hypothetical protein
MNNAVEPTNIPVLGQAFELLMGGMKFPVPVDAGGVSSEHAFGPGRSDVRLCGAKPLHFLRELEAPLIGFLVWRPPRHVRIASPELPAEGSGASALR